MPSLNPRRLVFPAVLLLSITSLFADEKPYTGDKWALLDPKQVLEAAKDITLAKYPDSDDATVEEKMVQTYRPDGTGENQDEVYLKVLTEKGKEDRRTLQLGFLLPYFTVAVAKLEVIRPDGTVVPVDVAANSAENIDSSQMDENIFDPNSKVLQVNIPDLEIGDVVHWVTHFNIDRPIMPGEFSDLNEFEGPGYVRHMVYEVYSPKEKPLLKTVLKDEVPGTVKYTETKEANGDTLHHWDISNVSRMFDEPSMPPYENVLQRLLVGTTPSWQDVSKWYWNLSQAHLDATSPELKKTVGQLTANSKTDLDKAKALFYYVSQKIRYMGVTPEKDRPGFEPHDVSMTFEKQYGVCRDKAALLVSMLRTAGLKAYPVLVNVGSKKDIESPDPGFNHAICALELVKGQYILMDPTDQHARDLQPWYDGDQSYLVARPEGETLKTSAFKPPEDNLVRIRTTGTLTTEGKLKVTSVINFEGANDDVYRNAFADMKPDDRRRYFEEMLKKAIPGAKVESLTLSPDNMLDVSKPLTAYIVYSAEGMTATGHDASVVSVPWIGDHVGLVHRALDEAGLDKRKYPMQTRVACGLDEQVSLKLGNGFGALDSAQDNAPVEDACLSYQQTFGEKDGTLNCSRQLRLKTVEVNPAQYAELRHTLKVLGYDERKSPVLAIDHEAVVAEATAVDSKTPPVAANATIVYSHKDMNVTDAHSAVLHVKFSKRILTYAGKIEEAEIKLNFNPSCEDAKFIKGEVISPSGQKQEISNVELNVMDAKWNSTAKRYTGGKVLVASLPGVDVGSIINVEFEITMKNKAFIAGFEPFQLPDDLTEKTFKLSAPSGLQIQNHITGAVKATGTDPGQGTQTWTWNTEKMSALPMEADVPPDWSFMTGVSYFVGDYKAYLKELDDTMTDRSNSRTKAAELAKQLAAKSKDKLDTVRAIRDFVAKSIRPAGPSFTELPLKELSTADTTLEDGYGHGADRAILLHAMLSAVGFQPEFVLASDLPPVDGIRDTARTFPLPNSYSTPMVKVTVDGQAYYLNDTDEYAELGSTPHDDRLAMNLASEDTEVIKAAKDCQNRVETDYTLSFADNGQLQMDIQKHFFGDEYNERNRYFSQLRPEERKRYYQQAVSEIDQGAKAVGDLTEQYDSYPGTEKFAVKLDNYAVVDGKYCYFDLPFTPSLVQLPGGDHRTLPLMLSREANNTVHTEIQLPLGYHDVLIAPSVESLDAPAGGGTARVTSSAEGGKYVLTDDFDTAPAVIRPSDYPAIQKLESALERKSGKVFLLEKD